MKKEVTRACAKLYPDSSGKTWPNLEISVKWYSNEVLTKVHVIHAYHSTSAFLFFKGIECEQGYFGVDIFLMNPSCSDRTGFSCSSGSIQTTLKDRSAHVPAEWTDRFNALSPQIS
ncbi:hypothetical protein TNIN_119131 [Trichonephila inaurata madagascariensis]|uniref:Uncharacterized protein n=1 Tax=Trichonephila inaurata madagascariensis TaxID=2747483 RepID=A0A8X6WR55_9ARAC|nr:hypothetical protein TNIN_276791 [Trichonephila inaurata madagascariensis]GFY40725.1 hypothetical protein TNIN_119131 [Trichonephila inaurata madagascariensis]